MDNLRKKQNMEKHRNILPNLKPLHENQTSSPNLFQTRERPQSFALFLDTKPEHMNGRSSNTHFITVKVIPHREWHLRMGGGRR